MITYGGRIELFRTRVGSKEYNLNTDDSDDDFKVFILPTFDDLYTGNKYSKMSITNNGDFDVHDIRKLYNLLYNSNINFLGALYSDVVLLNANLSDELKKLIRDLFEMRDEISTLNLNCLYGSSMGIYASYKKEMHSKRQDLIDKYGYNTKAAMNIIRVLDFIIQFAKIDFKDFKLVYKYKSDDSTRKLLMDIKEGKYSLDEYDEICNEYLRIAESFKDKYKSNVINNETNNKLQNLIKNMVKCSLKDN